ncbi:polysaccharide pyruvyl transferase family protein [Bacteroides sp. HF-5092]|uniref:polysaccharide pyruvyl transferase family protein n=1 Tax=Bacteroides TaxID=816 RepID=UPI00117827F3|nr:MULTISPECIES: polysaccharide pyruvyl transferase family protein [Bacteroides]TRX45244.1 polysaccharide pyruvyl transferase family protein [Bacteroides sp. HF-5092]
MKVCIVTWLGTGNFGTSLQSYALHMKLSEMGYNVSILHCFTPDDFTFGGRIYKWLKLNRILFSQIIKGEYFSKKQKKIRQFNKKNYCHQKIKTYGQYKCLLQETQAFVTGSDQIWNCYNGFAPFYFLDFAGDVKRIAYASSMGTSDFPQAYKSIVKELLAKFSHIGVRETTAVPIISELLERTDIVQVSDPTFLLSSTQWLDFAMTADIEIEIPSRFILCYFVGNNLSYQQQVEDIKQHLGIEKVILIPSLENKHMQLPHAQIYNAAGPKEFVRLLSYASFICTDSFHAIALSINLQKDFIALKRFQDADEKSQNSRIYDVLEHYGLMWRIYDNQDLKLYRPISFSEINEKILSDQEQCVSFLKSAIEN